MNNLASPHLVTSSPHIPISTTLSHQQLADSCYEKGDYVKCLTHQQLALDDIISHRPQDFINTQQIASINDRLSFLCNKLGKFENALQYCEASLSIRQEQSNDDQDDNTKILMIENYKQRATIYRSQGLYSKAGIEYEKCLELASKILPESHWMFADINLEIGVLKRES